jgi:WD40 repeat protein
MVFVNSDHRIGAITGFAAGQDGETFLTGVAEDKFIYQWNVTTGQEVKSFSSEGKEIFGIALSLDGNLLAAGDQDGNIHLWEVESGKKLHTLSGHAELVLRLTFNQDGSQLASTGFDRLAKVWDVSTGEELASLYGNTSKYLVFRSARIGTVWPLQGLMEPYASIPFSWMI